MFNRYDCGAPRWLTTVRFLLPHLYPYINLLDDSTRFNPGSRCESTLKSDEIASLRALTSSPKNHGISEMARVDLKEVDTMSSGESNCATFKLN